MCMAGVWGVRGVWGVEGVWGGGALLLSQDQSHRILDFKGNTIKLCNHSLEKTGDF